MIKNSDSQVTRVGIRLLDTAYMTWSRAESESERALRDWLGETGGRRTLAYAAYRAALDREEAAARDLQRQAELALPCRECIVYGEVGERK